LPLLQDRSAFGLALISVLLVDASVEANLHDGTEDRKLHLVCDAPAPTSRLGQARRALPGRRGGRLAGPSAGLAALGRFERPLSDYHLLRG
jgi:hypothetical protein